MTPVCCLLPMRTRNFNVSKPARTKLTLRHNEPYDDARGRATTLASCASNPFRCRDSLLGLASAKLAHLSPGENINRSSAPSIWKGRDVRGKPRLTRNFDLSPSMRHSTVVRADWQETSVLWQPSGMRRTTGFAVPGKATSASTDEAATPSAPATSAAPPHGERSCEGAVRPGGRSRTTSGGTVAAAMEKRTLPSFNCSSSVKVPPGRP
mmetsp:Transcript_102727/g.296983  ORF Transcript_102727/g.296983 Transcript_102727/m.296983 type:complete len:209 (-) Transcript_102727:313-939(-)